MNDSDLVFLFKRCPSVRALRIPMSGVVSARGQSSVDVSVTSLRVSDTGARVIAQSCGDRLTALDISGSAVTDVGVSALAAACVALAQLTLVDCAGPLTDASLKALGESAAAQSLRQLNVPSIAATDAGIRALAAARPPLVDFVLQADKLTAVGVEALAMGCPGLETLVLHQLQDADAAVRALSAHCTGLRVLSLDGADATDALLDTLAAAPSEGKPCLQNSLRHLNLARNMRLTGRTMSAALAACRALDTLDFSECVASNAWVAAAAACPAGLRSLSIDGCMRIDENGVGALAPARSLRELRACGVPGVTDRSLGALASACPALRVLDISDCGRVTEAGVRALSRMRSLRVLSVAGLSRIDDAAVEKLTESDDATALYIPSRPGLSPAAVAGTCVLEELDVSRTRLTDDALLTLSQNCPRLVALRLLGCGITDRGCMHLAHGCEALRLVLCDSAGVSGVGVRALRRGCPQLVVAALERSLALAHHSGADDDATDVLGGADDLSLLGGSLPVRRASARYVIASRPQGQCCELC
jgi:hypothetical protein